MPEPAQHANATSKGGVRATTSSAAAALDTLGSLDAQLAALADDLIAGDFEDVKGEFKGSPDGPPRRTPEDATSAATRGSEAQSAGASLEETPQAGWNRSDSQEDADHADATSRGVGDAVPTERDPSVVADGAEREGASEPSFVAARNLERLQQRDPDEVASSCDDHVSAPVETHSTPSETAGGKSNPVTPSSPESSELEGMARATARAPDVPTTQPGTTPSYGNQVHAAKRRSLASRLRTLPPALHAPCLVLSRPLLNRPPIVRKATAIIALWTLLLAAFVIYSALTRPDPTPKTNKAAPSLDHDPPPSEQAIPSKP